jgi:hypothetical protein
MEIFKIHPVPHLDSGYASKPKNSASGALRLFATQGITVFAFQ